MCGTDAAHESFTMNSDQARQRAEKRFKQEKRARDGRAAVTEYEVEAVATREKTARLKALRLAKEALAQNEDRPAQPTKRRSARRKQINRFVYRCPITGLTVEGQIADESSPKEVETYTAVTCTACRQVHLVIPKTGKVLWLEDDWG
jgi:hypothetical protein